MADMKIADEKATEQVKEEVVTPEIEYVFEGGPTIEELRTWDETYNVYAVEFGVGQTFFYRPINRLEFKQINSNPDLDVLIREEMLCAIATIWPQGYDFSRTNAGIPTSLAEEIMDKSGFAPTIKSISAAELLGYEE